jgi:hypothetical protein
LPSTGAAAATQAIASPTGAPDSGAFADAAADAVDVDVAADSGDEVHVLLVGGFPAARDGLIGVSAVGPGRSADSPEQPATSTDAANNTAIRIRPG